MLFPLPKALGLPEQDGSFSVSIIGGGGKTTLLYRLGRELAEAGFSVALTTTTHLRPPEPGALPWLKAAAPGEVKTALGQYSPVLLSGPEQAGRIGPPEEAVLETARQCSRFLIAEADGSRGLPLKFPASHEPALLPGTDFVVLVMGLSALGKPLDAVCHRAAQARRAIPGLPEQVTPQAAASILLSPEGRPWNIPPGIPWAVLLNQRELCPWEGERLARLLVERGAPRVVLASLALPGPGAEQFFP